jgi:hypothetical protein
LPASSTTQTAVSACDTPRPTNCCCSMTAFPFCPGKPNAVAPSRLDGPAGDHATFYGVTPSWPDTHGTTSTAPDTSRRTGW